MSRLARTAQQIDWVDELAATTHGEEIRQKVQSSRSDTRPSLSQDKARQRILAKLRTVTADTQI